MTSTLAFTGSGLDRAAHLRGDSGRMDALLQDAAARILPLWRGKLLCEGDGCGWLPLDHPVLDEASGALIFLGLDEAGPRFAQDMSDWTPPPGETPPEGVFFDPTEQHHPLLDQSWCFAELRGRMSRMTPRDGELAAMARSLTEWHRTHRFCARCGHASHPTQAGWQRQCPDCGGQHFPRTDPVVIMRITRGNRVLVGRSPGWPEGMYSLLAGFIEPGETVEAAVRREVFEESGVRVGTVRLLSSQPWPYPSSLMLGCEGVAESDDIVLDPAELEAALWVTREDMAEAFAGRHPLIRPPRKGAIAGHLIRNWLAATPD